MVPFFLIRHGETDWNVQRKLQGQTDIPLNALGKQQAQALADLIKPLQIQSVFSSDLSRAIETAQLAFANQQHLLQEFPKRWHSGLREVNLGTQEGGQWTEMTTLFGQSFVDGWMSADSSFDHLAFPEGESKGQLKKRFSETLQGILHTLPAAPVAIVTHGLAIRTFIHSICHDLEDTFRTPNCAVLSCEYSPQTKSFKYVGPKKIDLVLRPILAQGSTGN